MEINPTSTNEQSLSQTPSPQLGGVYGEKIAVIREKIQAGDFQGARKQIQKEFDEINAKYKGFYMFLDLARFKGELNALKQQVTSKL